MRTAPCSKGTSGLLAAAGTPGRAQPKGGLRGGSSQEAGAWWLGSSHGPARKTEKLLSKNWVGVD